jgi:hypothetical protein
MAAASRGLGRPEAAQRVADELLRLAGPAGAGARAEGRVAA